jgi:hypothetical protein
MTVQNLYTQYLDGKITKQKFLYEVRRDQNLDMISSNNSFDDVVKILKNKSIISEKAHKEAKQATGKQEVEIIAKTIDMVNPYEYTRGMNYELEIMDVPATSGDLSEDNVLKAQKKVLANLTKNSQYYFDKVCGKGEVSEEWVEVTKKEMDKIGKGKSKIIREGYSAVLDLPNGNYFAIDDDWEDEYQGKNGLFFTIKGNNLYDIDGESIQSSPREFLSQFKPEEILKVEVMKEESSSISKKEILQALIPVALNKEEIKQYMQSLSKSGDKFDNVDDYVEDFRNYVADKSLEEHGEYFDRVADVNADSSPLEEKKLRIYEKYAQKMNKTVDEVKCMVDEAIALKDKAGNIQYAKDSTEASNIERNAKTKGITLTKTAV